MDTPQLKPITILGAGSWGSALALYLARRQQTVHLWSGENSEISALLAERTNNRYLPGFDFPDNIHPTVDLAHALKEVDDILIAVPSIGLRTTFNMLKPYIRPKNRLLCATKGLDAHTGKLAHEIATEIFSPSQSFAVLSGPSFAREVAAGLPTAVTIACKEINIAHLLSSRFNSAIFHLDVSDDVIGVEIGGIVKNIIAIAAGILDGIKWGSNARAALMTRGLTEMKCLGRAMGAKTETFIGLSGLGDLILTCSDNQSRNKRLGIALGSGQSLENAEKDIGQVVEGKCNAEWIYWNAKKYQVEMPICEAVWFLLQNKISLTEAIAKFL